MNTQQQPRSSLAARSGFTVLELLIAVSITMLLAAIMLSVSVQVLKSYDRTAGRVIAMSQARVALDTIVSDLQSIVFRDDRNIWFVAEITNTDQNSRRAVPDSDNLWKQPSSPTREKPDVIDLNSHRFGLNGVWLRFFARPVDRDRFENPSGAVIHGDVCAVGYQILRRGATVDSEGVGTQDTLHRAYDLYRAVVNADRTFAAGYNLATASDYWTGGNTKLLGESVELLRPDRSLIIASNVIEFGVILLDENLSVLPYVSVVPTPMAYPVDGALLFEAPTSAQPMPAFVEVYLRVLNSDGARTILAFEQGRLRTDLTTTLARQDFWWETARANSVEFRRRVAIRRAQYP